MRPIEDPPKRRRSQLRGGAVGLDICMADTRVGLDELGWHTAARELIPASHRDLPMLRVYVPFIDRDGTSYAGRSMSMSRNTQHL